MVSSCSALLVSGRLAWAADMGVPVKLLGRDVGCIWPSSCLVAGCTLLAGVVKMTGGIEQAVASCSDFKGLGL